MSHRCLQKRGKSVGITANLRLIAFLLSQPIELAEEKWGD